METILKIGKTGPDPVVYRQVYGKIRDRIYNLLEKKESSPLPSEMKLSSEYNCSRVTIRRALSSLKKEGLIQRLPGRGTFPLHAGEKNETNARVVWQFDFEFFKLDSSNSYVRDLITPLRDLASREEENVTIHVDANEPMPLDPRKFTLWAKRIQADVVISQTASMTQEELVPCCKSGPPIVVWGRQSRFPKMDSVSVDYAGDIGRAIGLLYDLGHRRIAYVGFEGYDEPTMSRWQAYQTNMSSRGLSVLTVPCPKFFFYKQIYEYVLSFLTRPDNQPTALIAGGGSFGWPCLQALATRGLNIPQNISFLSIDDFEQAPNYDPPVSAVRQPLSQLVKQTIQVARQRVWKPNDPIQHVLMSSEIILRSSVAKHSGE